MRRILLTLAALAVVGCTSGESPQADGGIEISNARINPPLPGQTTGVAFMELVNSGSADRLIAITSPVSDRIELHTHLNEDGVMKMRRIPGIDLPRDEVVTLKPGSFHVMLFDTNAALGDEVVLTLDFETAEDLTVVAPVVLRGEMTNGETDHGSHSGH